MHVLEVEYRTNETYSYKWINQFENPNEENN